MAIFHTIDGRSMASNLMANIADEIFQQVTALLENKNHPEAALDVAIVLQSLVDEDNEHYFVSGEWTPLWITIVEIFHLWDLSGRYKGPGEGPSDPPNQEDGSRFIDLKNFIDYMYELSMTMSSD